MLLDIRSKLQRSIFLDAGLFVSTGLSAGKKENVTTKDTKKHKENLTALMRRKTKLLPQICADDADKKNPPWGTEKNQKVTTKDTKKRKENLTADAEKSKLLPQICADER